MAATHSARTDALTFDNAGLLALKLLAFIWMIADHADWLLGTGQGAHATIGRLVFPIFGAVLAYNMARTDPEKLAQTVVPRLAICGLVAGVPYIYLQGAALPLNIMFTLAASVAVYSLWVRGMPSLAIIAGLLLGTFVDYAWFGVFGVVFAALAFRTGSESRAMLGLFGFALSLTAINGNVWALLAVPLIWMASRLRMGDAPRMKWLFWAGYPVHLAALAVFKLAA